MPDWLIVWLGEAQGQIVRTLAAELRTGGIGLVALAFALGALHALTPGHGKAALAAYFLGREARIAKGVTVALGAALLHVLSGLVIFLVFRLIAGQMPSMLGRSSPAFSYLGYTLIIVAGLVMIVQSLRPQHAHGDGAHALTAGVGLLPCPLTMSVLGFAWTQSSLPMVLVVLVALALGVALTIGLVALAAIGGRRLLGTVLADCLPALERWSRMLQAAAGLVIVIIGIATMMALGR